MGAGGAGLLDARLLDERLLDALWAVLAKPGAPSATPGDVAARVREAARAHAGAAGGDADDPKWGLSRAAFEAALAEATAALEATGGPAATVDYEGMETPELKALLSERGMNCPLPMRRFIIEELRFFDANGRQGKRHPATKVLE